MPDTPDTVKIFPERGAIPPACFYNFGGLAMFLNHNPELKPIQPFKGWMLETVFGMNLPYVENAIISTFCSTISSTSASSDNTAPSISANPSTLFQCYERINICPNITNLSSDQVLKYGGQMNLFRTVYAHNSNAYIAASTLGWPNNPKAPSPVYYRFQTFHQYNEFKAAAAMVNKLYPQRIMAGYWSVPFPLPCIN
jgi:hypothetical protein